MRVQDLVYQYARTGKGYEDYVSSVNVLRDKPWFSKALGNPMPASDKWWQWYKTKMDIVPVNFLPKVNIPILFVWGALDELVPVEKSYQLVKERSKNKKVDYEIFEKASHTLFTNSAEPVHVQFMQEWLKKL